MLQSNKQHLQERQWTPERRNHRHRHGRDHFSDLHAQMFSLVSVAKTQQRRMVCVLHSPDGNLPNWMFLKGYWFPACKCKVNQLFVIWGTVFESPAPYTVCGISALLSVCGVKCHCGGVWDILWSCQCWSAERGSSLQMQQHHRGAQLYCNYWEDKCLVALHNEKALLRCWYYMDNIFLFNLTE